jgi:uncharacterized protein (DUF1015 family)
MSIVRPFRALRPRKSLIDRVASPPYDVVDREEAKAMAAGNPISFLHVAKAEIDFPDDVSPDGEPVYLKAKANLQRMIDAGVFRKEETPCLYIYRQQMGVHRQYGVVAVVPVEAYESGLICRHELTLREKEEDRTRHIDTVGAQTGLVFLTYRQDPAVDGIVGSVVGRDPEYDFRTGDGIGHTVWVVSDREEIALIREVFRKVETLYIADGHHRAAAAVTVARRRRERNPEHRGDEEYNFFMAAIFPHDQLKILDYNRVVKDLNGLSVPAFLGRVEERFIVREDGEATPPAAPHTFGMYLQGRWYLLETRETPDPEKDIIGALDVSILQERLLGPVLDIGDPRTDRRILFVGGARGMGELERLVDSGRHAVAFALHPTTIGELMAVADRGKIMPPKSTWFEPKLRGGIFIHCLEDF